MMKISNLLQLGATTHSIATLCRTSFVMLSVVISSLVLLNASVKMSFIMLGVVIAIVALQCVVVLNVLVPSALFLASNFETTIMLKLLYERVFPQFFNKMLF